MHFDDFQNFQDYDTILACDISVISLELLGDSYTWLRNIDTIRKKEWLRKLLP